jgi:membrane protease subunit HflC
MGNGKFNLVLIVLGLVLVVVSQTLFIVDEREQAIVLQLGQPIGQPRGPGLHLKVPLIQDVRRFDRRILPVDPPSEQVVISSSMVIRSRPTDGGEVEEIEVTPSENADTPATENTGVPETIAAAPKIENVSGEPIIVDSFARYKITDPLQFMKTLRTVTSANDRIETILNDAARTVLGKTTLRELLSEERDNVMNDIKNRVNRKIAQDQLGIEIVDVRIVRAELTADLLDSTVRRMISELKERATETRAKGEERALEIRSTAEKERTIILAEGERDAQILRGEGDNEAITIYADAFNKDKEFYGFVRSMEAYGNTLADPDTRLILSPDSDFFRFFDTRSGR